MLLIRYIVLSPPNYISRSVLIAGVSLPVSVMPNSNRAMCSMCILCHRDCSCRMNHTSLSQSQSQPPVDWHKIFGTRHPSSSILTWTGALSIHPWRCESSDEWEETKFTRWNDKRPMASDTIGVEGSMQNRLQFHSVMSHHHTV